MSFYNQRINKEEILFKKYDLKLKPLESFHLALSDNLLSAFFFADVLCGLNNELPSKKNLSKYINKFSFDGEKVITIKNFNDYFLDSVFDGVISVKNFSGGKRGKPIKLFSVDYFELLKKHLEFYHVQYLNHFSPRSKNKFPKNNYVLNFAKEFSDEIKLLSKYFVIFLEKYALLMFKDKFVPFVSLVDLIELFIKDIDFIRSCYCLEDDYEEIYFLFLSQFKKYDFTKDRARFIFKKLSLTKSSYDILNVEVVFKFEYFLKQVVNIYTINSDLGFLSWKLKSYITNSKDFFDLSSPSRNFLFKDYLLLYLAPKRQSFFKLGGEKISLGDLSNHVFFDESDFFKKLVKLIWKHNLFDTSC